MGRLFKSFPDGSQIEYDRGQFDDWCVYLSRPKQRRFAPKDTWYFSELVRLGSIHGKKCIYDDFVKIYEATTATENDDIKAGIARLAAKYGDDAIMLDILLTILYASMIAEENKANTRLGKRIKRLGMHQILMEDMPPHEAANYSKGMKWSEIAELCQQRGF